MTKQQLQALKDLRDQINSELCDSFYETSQEGREALDAAIKTLDAYPCGDCVSRSDAEALFRNARKSLMEADRREHIKDFNTRDLMLLNAEQMIHMLPAVKPDRKQGEWIQTVGKYPVFVCSVCGTAMMQSDKSFCAKCGADMRGEQT